MKILSREQFLLLPKNTLYAKYEPCVFGTISIKGCDPKEGWSPDFISEDMSVGFDTDNIDRFHFFKPDEEFALNLDNSTRDGLHESEMLFAVFDNEDIELLIDKLKTCIS